jgi:3'(2'), 5'-bisphosphate nucleotidase
MKYALCDLVDTVAALARAAGERILRVYDTDFDVSQKEDRTPVTAADLAAHAVINAGLARLTPQLPLLSEESGPVPFAERASWTRYWLVDPLDGTREFIKRNGEFTVNIALVDEGEAVLGVVYVPVTRVCYMACRGAGAFRQDPGRAPQAIHVRTYRSGRVTVAGSRSHGGEALQAYLQRLGDYELVSLGSALKSCLVAEGKADLYPRFGPTSEWDTAAAQCIVEEAGGRVTDTRMQRLRYNAKESLINPSFFVFGTGNKDWSICLPDAGAG